MKKNNIEDELFGDLGIEKGSNKDASHRAPLNLEQSAFDRKRGMPTPSPQKTIKPKKTALKIPPPPEKSKLPIVLFLLVLLLCLAGAAGYMLELGPFAKTSTRSISKKNLGPLQQVQFVTTPPNAEVWVDGRQQAGKTPFRRSFPTGKEYRFQLRLQGYKAINQWLRLRKKPKPIKLQFKFQAIPSENAKKAEGKMADGGSRGQDEKDKASEEPTIPQKSKGKSFLLTVNCSPNAALLILRPLMLRSKYKTLRARCPSGPLAVGLTRYQMTLSKKGFKTLRKTLSFSQNSLAKLRFRLEAKTSEPEDKAKKRAKPSKGKIDFRSNPSGMTVYHQGKKIGRTPLKTSVPTGRQRFRFAKGSLSKKITLYIRGGRTSRRVISFGKGTLKFFVKPWGIVWLDGKKIGETPMPPQKVSEGRHLVEFRMNSQKYRKVIRVKAGRTIKIRHTFSR